MSEKVDPQITDAVTQTNVKVMAEAPSMAMGNIYQAMAHSTGMMFENSVNAQNQANIIAQAATTQGVTQIYAMGAASQAPDNLLSLLATLKATEETSD